MFKPFFLSNTANRHFQSATDLHQQDPKFETQNKEQTNTRTEFPQKLLSPNHKTPIIDLIPKLFFTKKQQMKTIGKKSQPNQVNPLESIKRTFHQLQFLKAKSPIGEQKYKLSKINSNQYGVHDKQTTMNIIKSNGGISDSSESCQSDGFFLIKNKKNKDTPTKPLISNASKKIQQRNFASKQPKCEQLKKNMARCPMFLRSANKKFLEDSPLRVFSSQDKKYAYFNKQQKQQNHQKSKKPNQFKHYKKGQLIKQQNKIQEQPNKCCETTYKKKVNIFAKGSTLKMCRSLQDIDHDAIHNNSENYLFATKKKNDNHRYGELFQTINKKKSHRKISQLPNLTKISSIVVKQKIGIEKEHAEQNVCEQKINNQQPQHKSAKLLIGLKHADKLLSPKVKSQKQSNLGLKYMKKNHKLNTLSKIDTHVQTDNISNMSKSKSTVKIFRLTSLVLFPTQAKTYQFIVVKTIAEHANSQTYLVIESLTKSIYCLKKLKINHQQAMMGYINQYKIQSYIEHPYAVKLYGTFHDQKNLFLLMQYMQGQSLIEKQKKFKKMMNLETHKKKDSQMSTQLFFAEEKMDWIRSILNQMLKILSVLHIARIIHRDVKPGNILVSHSTYKLGDFGSSTVVGSQQHIGTLDYAAPQILTQKPFDQAIDIWSLACIAYELDVGRPPFFHQSRQITKKNVSELDYNVDLISNEVLKDFISKTLRLNPKQRLSASQALKHQFLTKIPSFHLEI